MQARKVLLLPLIAMLVSNDAAAHPGPVNIPGRIYYECHYYSGHTVGPDKALVKIDKVLDEDGKTLNQNVSIEARGLALGWSNAKLAESEFGIDWGDAWVTFSDGHSNSFADRRRGENSWQSLIVRDDLIQVADHKNDKFLIGPIAMALMSDPAPLYTVAMLRVRLGDLLAWQTGAKKLTGYVTRNTMRKERTAYGDYAALQSRRVVETYDIDIWRIRRLGEEARNATGNWEKSIVDFKTVCERQVEEDQSLIVLTEGRVR
jgi:hypothetical protein